MLIAKLDLFKEKRLEMFDTLRYSKTLEAVGISREQAEAHVGNISEILESNLTTKQDIKELKSELKEMEYRLIIKLSTVVLAITTLAVAILKTITTN